MTALAFAVALPGLAIGSFLNVVAARVPLKRSIVHPPSACMGCGQEIAKVDNIPVLSWLLLRGRCRHCDARISARYPAIELVTAALVVASFVAFGATVEGVLAAGFCVVLVTLGAIDVEHGVVPNTIVFPAAGVCLAVQTALEPGAVWLVAALAAAGVVHAVGLLVPQSMVSGEAKLAFLLGAMLGAAVVVAVIVALVCIAIRAAVRSARSSASESRSPASAVAFLAFGGVVALFVANASVGLGLPPLV